MRLSIGVALAAALSGVLLSAQTQTPSFRAGSEIIVVPAVVLDRKGAIVHGLNVEDFQLFEDGQRVPIEVFEPLPPGGTPVEGRFIVLVLDNLRTPAELGPRVQTIARKFADRMGPRDVVSVISLNAGRASTTTSQAEVRAAISRFRPALGDSIRTVAEDSSSGLRTIAELAQQVAKVQHRRKVFVFIGSASMFSPQEPSAFDGRGHDLSSVWLDAVRSTANDNVSVYAVDAGGHGGAVVDYADSFASETGGMAWGNTNNFDGIVDRIWRESGQYYLLGYALRINDHKLHKIDVKVTVPGLTVRARKARG